MRIAFTINDLATEHAGYTTTQLALRSLRLGHEIWYVEVGNFAMGPNDGLSACARRVGGEGIGSREDLISILQNVRQEQLDLAGLDVLFLRNDPAADALNRPWAQLAGVNFGRLAQQAGVLVVNNPDGLYRAVNKLYLQLFPQQIRPRTLISRQFDAVRDFMEEVGGMAVVKPLRGSGGHNVFLIRQEDHFNLRQIFDAICREGYLIAQEYIPASVEGDTRLFLLNGEIIEVDGKVAAVRRVPAGGDLRSNLTAGGHAQEAVITERYREIAELARPQLQADDMFFVGLDLIGEHLVEINVFSPGALIAAEHMAGVDFSTPIIKALERRVARRRS